MGRHPEYENMSKEELLALIRKKQKNYSYRAAVTLTIKEGEILKQNILPCYGCENPSQLLKKIVRGELILLEKNKN